jgi:Ca-activated chloride channel family protein
MMKNPKYNFWGMFTAALILELIFWIGFAVLFFFVIDNVPGLRLQRPELIWLFGAGFIMFLVFTLVTWNKNRSLDRFSESGLLGYLVSDISSTAVAGKFLLWRLAASFLVLALINPQMGSKMAESKVKGIEIMLALDVSNSMRAEDLKPNRLTLSKRAMEKFLDNLRGDRVGIVVFAGQAFVQLPITNDYSAGKLFLSAIKPEIVAVQGTAIGAAIELSLEGMDFNNPAQKAIIVISDGENHEDDAIGAARAAAERGVRVYTIGLGSPTGSPIPEYLGNEQIGFKKDGSGSTVITKLNEDMLREIATAGNGTYIRASNSEMGLTPLLEEINALEKTEMGTVSFAEYEDRFQLFLALAMICMLIEWFIIERKGRLSQQIKIFN